MVVAVHAAAAVVVVDADDGFVVVGEADDD